ncbi:TetR/AcrR family transcriptional regulator [Blastococcus sp. Marseille-P5729]|uniref:TetR/AcrR family transcriptional regulator n=1 Tax=Blastococcus sp. Marseille-P5729 TaxID=2086582 RepID=UPI001F245058|nr:TetR/AcrR family transcriptional regulator [Blastococcus sp. Marseille-P5729]
MTTSSTRRRQHDAHSLLQVAVRTFNERGYDGTSMDAIASAAGITKSSIYHHVSGKEALLGQALDHAVAALDDALLPAEQALQMHARPIDAIETVVRRTTAALLKDVETITLFLRVRGNSETERRAIESRRAFDERVSGLLQAAADAGELRAGIDPPLMTRLVFGTVNSLVEWYRPGGRLSPQQVEDHVVALVLDGLRSRD